MNEQQLFDIAYAGLAKQGFKKSSRSGRCLYRGPKGLKCAIGQAIPDEKYEPEMDAKTQGYGTPFGGILSRAIGYEGDYDFASSLQMAHDESKNPAEMKKGLWLVASDYGLTVPQLESDL